MAHEIAQVNYFKHEDPGVVPFYPGLAEVQQQLTRLLFPLEAGKNVLGALGLSAEDHPYMAATYRIKLGVAREETTLVESIKLTGIILQKLVIGDHVYSVEETLAYAPWSAGVEVPGAGQIGVYQVKSQENGEDRTTFMAIRDYQAGEEGWRVLVEEIADSEEALREQLSRRDDLLPASRGLREYLTSPFKGEAPAEPVAA